jgi:hypothetical protein
LYVGITKKAQAESPNQVDVLKRLYELRLTLLDCDAPLKNRLVEDASAAVTSSSGVLSWLRSSSVSGPKNYFNVEDLTPLVKKTRELLFEYFETRFFNRFVFFLIIHAAFYLPIYRYIDRCSYRKKSYAFELQMLLHPNYKNLDKTLKRVMQKIHGAMVSFILLNDY